MNHELTKKIKDSFNTAVEKVKNLSDLEQIRVSFLGKKGTLTEALSTLSTLSLEMKKELGSQLHSLKDEIQDSITKLQENLNKEEEEKKLSTQKIDVTLPGNPSFLGSLHPITKTIKKITSIFASLGFSVQTGPEIETEYYNFDMLNIPAHHPARTAGDTFFIDKNLVLRTQTSGVQIRTMEKMKPPLAIVSPGRCFRKDEIDATHLPLFHQIEGLLIDKNITFADLKGVLTIFAKEFFGSDTSVRFRPDFFPFTEPSAEVAFSCPTCGGRSTTHCGTCRGSGYIEVAGCGLVHPTVLKNGGIDPTVYSGFAFGFGIERLTMIYYGIPDIRLLYENSPSFLEQFNTPLF